MRLRQRVGVIIPALDEAQAIGHVLDAIPGWVDDIVVVDNGSLDATAIVARAHGARVAAESVRGYGSACQTGIRALEDVDIVVFLDGDFSDYPDQMGRLVDPIARDEVDFVVGVRECAVSGPSALTPVQRVGNGLACRLIYTVWRTRYTDLGPFRAIRRTALETLSLRDGGFGWTVEMQIKAARRGLRIREMPTDYRHRIGRSKISGTLRGALGAGGKILAVIVAHALHTAADSIRRIESPHH